jgi:hypothetical protein
MTYAPEHEKELFDRSHRRRMGGPQAPRSCSQQTRTTEDSQLTQDPRCSVLRLEERLPLAATPSRVPAVGGRLLVV